MLEVRGTMINQAVIAAGGLGTRLSELYPNTPKCFIKIGPQSLLVHAIRCLKKNGVSKFHLLLGTSADIIIRELDSISKEEDVYITYNVEDRKLGTAGAIINAIDFIEEEFFFFYGDLVLDTDLGELRQKIQDEDFDFAQLVHPSSHLYDSDIVKIKYPDTISGYYTKPHPDDLICKNLTNVGIYAFKKKVFQYDISENCKTSIDLDRELLPQLILKKYRGAAVRNYGYVKDVGTPDRLTRALEDYEKGHMFLRKKPALFIDRDGTINKENGYISNFRDLHIYDDAVDLISRANKLNFWVFVITNQPVIARGEASMEDLKLVHEFLETYLAKKGAFIDEIFYCPHHPDSGFDGEVKELKINCTCRKPGIGLIHQAIEKFKIDMDNSFFVGNTITDMLCAKNSNLKFFGVDRDDNPSLRFHHKNLDKILLN